jgi:hypothetical protein
MNFEIEKLEHEFDKMFKWSCIKDDDFDENKMRTILEGVDKKKLTFYLAELRSLKLMQLFIDCGADVNGTGLMGCPVLHSVCLFYSLSKEDQINHNKRIEVLLKNGADVHTKHPFSKKSMIELCKKNSSIKYQLKVLMKYV